VIPDPGPLTPGPVSRAAVLAWLAARQPAPPTDLASKLAECVDAAPEAVLAGESLPEVVGALGTWLLQSVVERQRTAYDAAPDARRPGRDTSDAPPARSGPVTSATAPDVGRPAINTSHAPPAGSRRESSATALDLLAADAFVTYAFEAASEEGTDVAGLATRLLTTVRA